MQRLVFILLSLMLSLGAMAQQNFSAREKKEWMKEMQQYKNEFMVKKLKLTEEQKAKFIPLYNKMDCEIRSVVDQTMKISKAVRNKGEAATDLEKTKAAEAQFECKVKEGEIELKYFKEFKKILTPDQLLKIKDAERKFTKQLMSKHNEKKRKAEKKSEK